MKLLVKIKKSLATYLWLIVLFPSLFNFIHQLKSHDHLDCNETKLHFHKLSKDCNTCDYNFLAFDFKLVDNFENNKNQIFRTNKTDFKSVFINSYNSNNRQLRAPPSMS